VQALIFAHVQAQAVEVKVEDDMLQLLGSYFFAFLFNQARISIG
jgi:hypothetical protein